MKINLSTRKIDLEKLQSCFDYFEWSTLSKKILGILPEVEMCSFKVCLRFILTIQSGNVIQCLESYCFSLYSLEILFSFIAYSSFVGEKLLFSCFVFAHVDIRKQRKENLL